MSYSMPDRDGGDTAGVVFVGADTHRDTVHVAVVDPGVGTNRPIFVAKIAGQVVIGPDNGLLIPAAERAGGLKRAHELTERGFLLSPSTVNHHASHYYPFLAGRQLAPSASLSTPAQGTCRVPFRLAATTMETIPRFCIVASP
jgi:hypothetical protein